VNVNQTSAESEFSRQPTATVCAEPAASVLPPKWDLQSSTHEMQEIQTLPVTLYVPTPEQSKCCFWSHQCTTHTPAPSLS